MTRFKVEARSAPDYDPKAQRIPSWVVICYRDGKPINVKRFNGENPKKAAQEYRDLLRKALQS